MKNNLKHLILIANIVLFYGTIFGQTPGSGCTMKLDTLTGRTIFQLVDDMPEFLGGNEMLGKFIAENIKYPDNGQCISGRVYLKFIVEPDGRLTSKRVARGITKWADEEALRAIDKMPHWKPGTCNGKAVPVEIVLPIGFMLK